MIGAWGHDPDSPRLELSRPLPEKMLALQRRGLRHWYGYYKQRHVSRPELLRTYRGRWSKRSAPIIGHRAWKRSESAELHIRFAQLLLLHANVSSGEVGLVVDKDTKDLRRFRYGELAELLDCSIGQLKRAIRAFRAAGYIWRHQARDFDASKAQPYTARVASLKVTRAFWGASHVMADRDRWLAQKQREQRRQESAESEREQYRRRVIHDRISEQLQALARGAGQKLEGWKLYQAVEAEIARRRPPPT